MNRRVRITIAIGVCAIATSAAHAQLIVGNDQSGTATIYHIDVGTNVATPLYSSDTSEAKPWGMAYDPGTNTLYWNNGGTLYSSPFSMGGLTPTEVGQLTYNGSNTNFVGLGFRDGMLLGTRNIATEAVYEIDLNTLDATLDYQYDSAFDFGGIDVDATTGNLYGLSDSTSGGQGRGLYEIDTVGQFETFRAAYPAGETDIDGLAVYNGLAYYVTDQPGDFYVYDIASGNQVGTLTSPFTGSATFSAAAFVPAPGALALLGVAGIATRRRRRVS